MSDKQFVVFKLKNEEYGLEINFVEEILRYQEITKVPHVDEFILGVTNLRGQVIPIYNLKKKFYGDDIEITEDTRIVVIGYHDVSIGMLVDGVSEVLKISEDTIDMTENVFSESSNKTISGIGKVENRLLMLINIDDLFSQIKKDKIHDITENLISN